MSSQTFATDLKLEKPAPDMIAELDRLDRRTGP